MKASDGAEALVALEDSNDSFLFDSLAGENTWIWPQVRMHFAQAMAERELNSVAVRTSVSRFHYARQLARAVLPSPERFAPNGVGSSCFLVSGVTTRSVPGGRTNWLVDAFAQALDGSPTVFQVAPLGHDAKTRPTYAATRSLSRESTRADILTRFAPLSDSDAARVSSVVKAAAESIDFVLDDERIAKIEKDVLYQVSKARHFDALILKRVMRARPPVVYMEDASYGSRAGLIGMLKSRGVAVAELQHGWIGGSHSAYNFGAAFHTGPLRSSLPDHLLTFGEFWSRNIRHPAQAVPIGKPHLEDMAATAAPLEQRVHDVVIVSSVAEPEAAARLVLSLRDALPKDWRVLFRPHPSERASLHERYPTLVGADRVAIDKNSDVYDSLAQARGVVGVASTVLYEALTMGLRVFVLDSPFASLYIDARFGELVDAQLGIDRIVAGLLDASEPATIDSPATDIWELNARKNFVALNTQLSGIT